MKMRALAHILVFTALVVVAAVTVGRVVEPEPIWMLVASAITAVAVSLPGIVRRRLAPLSMLLLPAGAYVLARVIVPLPPDVEGWAGQWAFYRQALAFGADAYLHDVFPLTLGGVAGLELVVVLWVYLVLGAAGIIALGLRRPLLGTALALAHMGAVFTVDAVPADPSAVAALFLLALLVILTAGWDGGRRASGGLVAGGLGLGAAGLIVAFALLAGLPGLAPSGWQDWETWDPFGETRGGSLVFNWKQNYPELLDPANDFTVMRVTSPERSYWKANTLEYFTGDAWLSQAPYQSSLSSERGRREVPPATPMPPGETITERFDLEAIYTSYLFTGGVPVAVDLDIPGTIGVSEGGALRPDKAVGSPLSYRVEAVYPEVSGEDLAGRGRDYSGALEGFLALPLPSAEEAGMLLESGRSERDILDAAFAGGRQFAGIYQLNRDIVGDATDPYQIALRIERSLRASYEYSLSPPKSERSSPYAAFLLETGTGYCQHFAGSMSLLLRLNGIPSRVAVGFGSGTEVDENVYEVRTRNAHAWVEVFFPEVGWIPFEPTPNNSLPAPAASSTAPGFSDPFAEEGGSTSSEAEDPAGPANRIPEDAGTPPSAPEGGGGNMSSTVRQAADRTLLFGVLVGLILALRPPVRLAFRRVWARGGDVRERMRRSLELLRRELGEWGLDVPESLTLEEVALLMKERIGVDADPVMERAQAVFFGGSRARARDVRSVNEFRREARKELRRKMGWGATMRAWYGLGDGATATAVRRTVRRIGVLSD